MIYLHNEDRRRLDIEEKPIPANCKVNEKGMALLNPDSQTPPANSFAAHHIQQSAPCTQDMLEDLVHFLRAGGSRMDLVLFGHLEDPKNSIDLSRLAAERGNQYLLDMMAKSGYPVASDSVLKKAALKNCTWHVGYKGKIFIFPIETASKCSSKSMPQGCRQISTRDNYQIYILTDYAYPKYLAKILENISKVTFEEFKKQICPLLSEIAKPIKEKEVLTWETALAYAESGNIRKLEYMRAKKFPIDMSILSALLNGVEKKYNDLSKESVYEAVEWGLHAADMESRKNYKKLASQMALRCKDANLLSLTIDEDTSITSVKIVELAKEKRSDLIDIIVKHHKSYLEIYFRKICWDHSADDCERVLNILNEENKEIFLEQMLERYYQFPEKNALFNLIKKYKHQIPLKISENAAKNNRLEFIKMLRRNDFPLAHRNVLMRIANKISNEKMAMWISDYIPGN